MYLLACDGGTGDESADPTETGDGDGDPGDGDGDLGDGDGDPGDGDGEPGDGDGDEELSEERITAACEAVCIVDGMCDEESPSCVPECVEDHLEFEPECILERVVRTECVGMLNCAGYDLYMQGDPFGEPDYPCKTEDLAVFACAS